MPALMMLLLAADAQPAFAHGTQFPGHGLEWTFDPWILTPLILSLAIYLRGYVRLRRQSRLGRQGLDSQAAVYLIGWACIAAALVTPLHALGEELFTAHMVEHEVIMALGAPLLVMARPSAVLLWGLPDGLSAWIGKTVKSRSVASSWNLIAGGAVATVLHGAAIWLWHVPAFFDAAVEHVTIHRLQHLSFIGTALLFWWAMFRRSSQGLAAWHVFLTMLHTSLLGALIALSPFVLYLAQTRVSASFGLTPLEDQQLAGFVMWIPAGVVYAAAAIVMLAQWIARSSREVAHGPAGH